MKIEQLQEIDCPGLGSNMFAFVPLLKIRSDTIS